MVVITPTPLALASTLTVILTTEGALGEQTPTGLGAATATLELVPSPTTSLETLPLADVAGDLATATALPTALPALPLAGAASDLATAPALPTALPAPPSGDVAAGEQYTIDLINAQRASAGVPPLARDEALMIIARGRVVDMVARNYTGHTDPVTGEYLFRAMMQVAGYTTNWYGENWYGTSTAPPVNAEVAMNWFMTDPPHANNILSPHYASVGVGIAFNGQLWLLVQDFAGE